MRNSAVLLLAIASAACTTCCDTGNRDLEDNTQAIWQVVLANLDEALLSVCSSGGRLIAVGGHTGAGLALEWDGLAWQTASLPAHAGLLWWCWVDEATGTAVAVGENSTILRSERPGGWQQEVVALDATLYGVWGSSPEDLVAVGARGVAGTGGGVLLHYDGIGWEDVLGLQLPNVLYKVWGRSEGDIWAVGQGGSVLHHDGTLWNEQSTPTSDTLVSVWGDREDVYAVGGVQGSGVLLRFDGQAWTIEASFPERLSGVWTSDGEDLFVAGDRGLLAELDRSGTGEAHMVIADSTVDFHALAGHGDTVMACGADLLSGAGGAWRGALWSRGGDHRGGVAPAIYADAGLANADAGANDARASDASPAPGPGEPCAWYPNECAQELSCWGIASGEFCTALCETAADCGDFGANVCCAIPGSQTLQTVCIPGNEPECT